MTLEAFQGNEPVTSATIQRAVEAKTPVKRTTLINSPRPACEAASECFAHVQLEVPEGNQCPAYLLQREITDAERESFAADPRCPSINDKDGYSRAETITPYENATGSVGDLERLIGKHVPDHAKKVLAAGGVVVFDPLKVYDGKTLTLLETDGTGGMQKLELPGVYVPAKDSVVESFWSPGAVRAAGLDVRPTLLLFQFDRMPTGDEEQAARAEIANEGFEHWFRIERGYDGNFGIGLMALLAGSAIITLGAAGIATGLALADARSDHATLSAVGAAPRIRRKLSMSQAGALAALGTVLGVASGFVPGIAYVWAQPNFRVVVPWGHVATTVLLIPLVAAACAGLFTRSRIPLERRIS